ncbi:hypothetical protein B0T25DRAFT_554111 [Lasiosphaeria hispida]|uniref:PD-(D/E)XK nuclease-like domain-containing protein n=1 Tax=Lasiosphaeria hispida TaxID=260671 RepID=A0AAJ0MBL0_9PEZI|nr:hypothetical protein B0T25DRAFT_554111 [Lasiosphaeria hispida]
MPPEQPFIAKWLESIDYGTSDPASQRPTYSSRKRRRQTTTTTTKTTATTTILPSPNLTTNPSLSPSDRDCHDDRDRDHKHNVDCGYGPAMSHTPTKRQRRDFDTDPDDYRAADVDATPRPTRIELGGRKTPSLASDNDTASWASGRAASEAASGSQASRASSPRKQLARMQLLEDGFDCTNFRAVNLPPSLVEVVKNLQSLARGQGVIPASHRDIFVTNEADRTFIDERWFSPTAESSMTYPQVLAVIAKAGVCERKMHDEASWNVEVHHPLLAAVVRPGGTPSLVDVIYCPTAKIAAAYSPRNAPSRMVDFCLTINPDHIDPSGADIVAIESRLRIGDHVNHTQHEALRRTPIAVSIETKRSMIDGDTAQLQMGVWQSSQLRMLAKAAEAMTPTVVDQSVALDATGTAVKAATCAIPMATVAADARPKTTPSVAEWLPGIIVQGHEWNFVVTCRSGLRDNRPALLSSIPMGRTQEPLDVYCLLAAIRYLCRWAEETYWPIFRAQILGLS